MGTSTSASKESSWRPNALRSTVTSRRGKTGSSPSPISLDRRIMPAHVPKSGAPDSASRPIGSRNPQRSIRRRWAVLSPPGRTRPATPSRSAGCRTSTVSTPIEEKVRTCSMNAPWTARTPIFMAGLRSPRSWAVGLPAADGQALLLGERLERNASHGRAETLAHVGQDLGVVVVRRRLNDRVGQPGGVLALEDAGAHEDVFRAEL